MSAAEELAAGAAGPFGFFDPLGLSKVNPLQQDDSIIGKVTSLPTHQSIIPFKSKGKSESDIRKWREAELKHGRVSMIAALGILVGEEVEFGTPLFSDKVVGPAIYQVSRGIYPYCKQSYLY